MADLGEEISVVNRGEIKVCSFGGCNEGSGT